MHTYTIKVELDVVGHTAMAIDASGRVIATASGFGPRDARRRLNAILKGHKDDTASQLLPKKHKRRKKGGKMHNMPGVIFAAKRRMEEFMPRNAKFKKKPHEGSQLQWSRPF